MANTQAVATSFKLGLLNGVHCFGTSPLRASTTADSFKAALYLASGSLGASTTVYSTTSEVAGTNYTAGGIGVTNAVAPTFSGTAAYWTPSANLVWGSVTLTTAFDTVLIYNASQANAAVATYNFGSQTITAGNLTLTMPVNAAGTALLSLN
jgi:hypothetical protein